MIRKEFTALLPLWLTCCAAILASVAVRGQFQELALLVYFLGLPALASWPMGHEYSHRTLGALLTLPVPRSRIWLAKLAVVAPMLAVLGGLAFWSLPAPAGDLPFGIGLYFLAVLFITPWLTMAGGSALAGAVFTAAVIGLLLVIGEWVGIRRYGYSREVDAFRLQFMAWSLGGTSAIAAVLGWRMFTRLQAFDGPGSNLHLGLGRLGSREVTGVTRRSPTWLLVRKELRLTQLAWVAAGLYAAIYVTVIVTRGDRIDADNFATLITILYAGIVSLLVGSLAAAEDRHFGTHDAQLLLPVASARQWAVKAGTALVLVGILAILVPLVVTTLVPARGLHTFGRHALIRSPLVLVIVFLASVSLYASTLASSGLRALLLSLPVLFVGMSFAQRVKLRVYYDVYKWVWLRDVHDRPTLVVTPVMSGDLYFVLGATVLAILALWLALPNYRWTDRNWWRIGAHAAAAAAAIVVYFALAGALAV